jgi:hypothetical protein
MRCEFRETDFPGLHHHEFLIINRRVDQHLMQIRGVLLLSLKPCGRIDWLSLVA